MTTPHEPQSEHHSGSDDEGQVSEVASFKEPGEQISPEDSVAGAPQGESGDADEGPTGPDAVTNDEHQDHHPDQDDVETTG
ncbi:hypothetical protein GCM10023350_43430 [Nocardioides endophyticus]|uniref:Uncharacterized protein n=1 Tax=Nocardioides endophyticus TaxID=1353775 RepID=A0ABP8ZDG9_9ACTN